MKVRCIKRYSDVKLKKIIEVDTIFDVDEERAKHLVNEKVAEIVNETEKTTEKAAGKGKEEVIRLSPCETRGEASYFYVRNDVKL